MVSKAGKMLLRSIRSCRSDGVNDKIPLHDLQSGKIRESSNRSADGEVAINTCNGVYIARPPRIVTDGEVSARISRLRLQKGV